MYLSVFTYAISPAWASFSAHHLSFPIAPSLMNSSSFDDKDNFCLEINEEKVETLVSFVIYYSKKVKELLILDKSLRKYAIHVNFKNHKNLEMINSMLETGEKHIIEIKSEDCMDFAEVGKQLGISVFLMMADYVYYWALSYDDAYISIVSTIRRSGAIVPFVYGAVALKEKNIKIKSVLLCGVILGVSLLYIFR